MFFGAFFAVLRQKTGLSAAIFWLSPKGFPLNPVAPHGLFAWFILCRASMAAGALLYFA
jgi:hypothetical protein